MKESDETDQSTRRARSPKLPPEKFNDAQTYEKMRRFTSLTLQPESEIEKTLLVTGVATHIFYISMHSVVDETEKLQKI